MAIFTVACGLERNHSTTSNNKKTWGNQWECFEHLDEYQAQSGYKWVKLNIYKHIADNTFHFLTCDYDGVPYLFQLDSSMDIATLQDFGEFWVDKNAVYYKYLMSDGVRLFRLDTADRATFRTYGKTVYARDKDYIYDSRHGIIEEADIETFQPIAIHKETGVSVYAKDKNNYYFWDEVVDSIELKEALNIE